MIVTLYLISTNVYNSVDAPRNRGFSFIEIWMIGTQFPLILALCEYGSILFMKKTAEKCGIAEPKEKIQNLDFTTMIFSMFYFVVFVSVYCIIVLIKVF